MPDRTEDRPPEEDIPLVLCVGCGAMRAASVEACFCRETDTRPAPLMPPKGGKLF